MQKHTFNKLKRHCDINKFTEHVYETSAEEFHTMKKEKLIKLSNEEKVLALVLKTKYSSNYFCLHSALTNTLFYK